MKNKQSNYYIRVTIITAILAVIAATLFSTVLKEYYIPVFWVLLAFFYLIHLASHAFLVIAEKKNKLKFNTAYLISFSVKFIAYIVLLLVYLIINKGITYPFAISFFVLYLVYTIAEVRSTINNSKSSVKKFEKSD
ncbi:MAG: hypothetical protein JXB00_09675 [Bacteroidales bacterium]|nr:hypothetical protein [Bacteroidales bacterium]